LKQGERTPQTKPKAGLASLIARPLLAGVIAAGVAAPNSALADVFLLLDGIAGDSTDAKHKGEIDILTYTQSFKNTVSGSTSGGGAGKVTCGDVTVTKNIESPVLCPSSRHDRKHIERRATFRQSAASSQLLRGHQDVLITRSPRPIRTIRPGSSSR
jgi:hypothetical protein